jgi:hypothetical protein
MNTEPDTNTSATTSATTGDGDELDPTEAAAILAQATRQAKLEFDPTPPWRLVAMAFVALLAFGAIWLSVRGQHPYGGPSAWALVITYALVAGLIGISVSTVKRATTGVTGPSVRQRRTVIAAIVVVYIAVYVFMGALKYLGVSHAIVYGVYPAVGPLIIVGAAMAGIAAAKENWLDLGTALAVVAAGAICAYGGPVGAWLAVGISLFVIVSARAAVLAWRRRA